MKIAYTDNYGDLYMRDACFEPSSCKIGENLLVPGIKLKERLEQMGHAYHTIDMYDIKDIDVVLFSGIPRSIYTIESWREPVRFIAKRGWKNDWLYQVMKHIPKRNRLLIIMEPPVVSKRSYNKKYQEYFGEILTWDDDLVKKYGYHKFCYPQVKPAHCYKIDFTKKKFLVMMCSNKISDVKNELYSERRKVIDYYEDSSDEFDLYGFGWEKTLSNYKGTTSHKLDTLSEYKFSICYENCSNINGYITEKIFDCFFARCVPVYWGASNIQEYIPENCFIDRRKFLSINELNTYLHGIPEKVYQGYLDNIEIYLDSKEFQKNFSVDSYVDKIVSVLLK